MEPHSPHVHHQPGKKASHYFYEFLMLFLAVFCGFLAENWREHYVEHQREKQYARQLVADLRADSLQISYLYKDMSKVIKHQDAFIEMLSSAQPVSDKEVIAAFAPLQWIFRVNKTTSTYEQMKASGSLRYMRNTKLLGSMQFYYEIMLPYSDAFAEQSMRIYTTYVEPFSMEHFRRDDIDLMTDSLVNPHPVYRNRSEESDFKLRNIIVLYKEYLSISYDRFLKNNKKKVNELISELNKEYNLE